MESSSEMGALCDDCEQDMELAASCTMETISLDGREWRRVSYGDGHIDWLSAANGIRCPDCGVLPRGIHHIVCLKETCPACGDQLNGCSCYKDDGRYADARQEEMTTSSSPVTGL